MPEPLQTTVFIASDRPDGFGVSSTIVFGPSEAMVVDTQFSLANAHRLVAEVLETDRELTQIFITHLHPDHYLGLEAVVAAFPKARILAYGETADEINDAFDFKVEHWGKAVLGRNGANTPFTVERVDEDHLTVDGERIQIIGVLRGDSAHAAALWVPSIKTLIAADMAFSDAHLWVADSRTLQMRQEWLDTLDQLEALGAEVVIPGHAPHNRPYDPDAIGFTRRYLQDFIRELEDAADGADLMARMERLYPDAAVRVCLEMSAKILKDRFVWDGDWPLSLREMEAVI